MAAAQASAWVAEAQLQKAKVLWVPAFMMNAAYIRHDGYGPDFNGGVNVPQGENALGQPSPGSFGKPLNQNLNWFISGVSLYQAVATDRRHFPAPGLAAGSQCQTLGHPDRQERSPAGNRPSLLQRPPLSRALRRRPVLRRARRRPLARIDELSKDLVPRVEVDRARNLLAYLEEQAVSDRENWRVASADLTQVLRLDPRAVVEPLEHDHLQITLIDPARSLDDLIPSD